MIYLAWIAFFAASVGGHVALTLQTKAAPLPTNIADIVRYAVMPWSLACILCWSLSTVMWVALLEKHGLLRASSVSAIRYLLIAVAAWLLVKEQLGMRDAAGALLIAGGVWLVATR